MDILVLSKCFRHGRSALNKNDLLRQAVEAAWKTGIVVVVAAGNDGRGNSHKTNGYETISSPGNDPYAITVGAINTRETATRTDLVAPGNTIISALALGGRYRNTYHANSVPQSFYVKNGDPGNADTYFTLSGTSMAAPMVSGAVALMLQKDSSLTPDQVKARLMKTASKTFPAQVTLKAPDGTSYTVQHDVFDRRRLS